MRFSKERILFSRDTRGSFPNVKNSLRGWANKEFNSSDKNSPEPIIIRTSLA